MNTHPEYTRIEALVTRVARSVAPPPDLKMSDWADAKRKLSAEAAAEPGQWRTDRAPFQREPMNAISDRRIARTVLMWPSQTGKTEAGNNTVAYHIDQDPAPILMIQPTITMAEAWSKDRFDPMARDTPCLRDKLSGKKRDGDNTILHKRFPGGHLTIAGANSPASLASRPIRVVVLDEVDRFPSSVGKEGDPVYLAIKRTATFRNRNIIMISTPTIKGRSRIEYEYDRSDQRLYYVPCPHCDRFQTLRWEHMKWTDGDPETTVYICEACEREITEGHKPEMLKRGEWRPTAEFQGTRGYRLNQIYSPWVTWPEMVSEFLRSKDDPEKLQVFVNTALAETFARDDEGEKLDADIILERAEEYDPDPLPEAVLVITAGIDVQPDRIEYEILGSCLDEESYSLEYGVIDGSIDQSDTKQRLIDVLDQKFTHPIIGELGIAAAGIDTGGSNTDDVYKFVRDETRKGRRLYALKGASAYGKPIAPLRPTKISSHKIKLYLVGTDTAKDVIFARLKLTEPGPGYCRFPLLYPPEYFTGLVSEKVITKYEKGRTTRRYEKITASARNEPLDCRVYNLAALRILKPKFKTLHRRQELLKRKGLEATVAEISKPEKPVQETEPPFVQGGSSEDTTEERPKPPRKHPRSRRRSGGFVRGG